MTATTTNPFLTGNFAPIRQEIEQDDLTVIGELPPDLSGMFVRNGPNPQFPPIGEYHWFDGDGMLHGVQIQQGKARYCNRYIRTQGFLREREANQAIWTGLLEPPQSDVPDESFKNAANTALVWHAKRFLALWEGGNPHQVALPNLETVGACTFNNQLQSAFTAHPKVDPDTGEMLFFSYSFAPPYLQYGIVDQNGELSRTLSIDLPQGVMMHDFAITENYTVFLDLPLTFSPERMAKGEMGLAFERDRASRFGILPRHGDPSEIRWFEAPSCFIFHVLNAYEEGDEVVLMACRMNAFNLVALGDNDNSNDQVPYLHQWRFNLKTGKVQERNLSPFMVEFPRINEQKTGRKMRYGFAGKMSPHPMPLFEGLVKFDFENQADSEIHYLGDNRYCGEAVFAPRDGGTTEDDGWLLTLVHDENLNQSELLVVDAQQMTNEPVARVIMPQRVPYGFHATWVSQQELQATAKL